MRSKNRSKRNRNIKGVCLWNNIEILFDVAKSGVGGRRLNKLDLRILAGRRELYALTKRGIEGVELADIINRDGCSRKVGIAEIERHENELRSAFRETAEKREETHTMEVPRWIMNALSTGQFTVTRGISLLFYLYRRLVKTKNHLKNWIKVGQAYGRFKLSDLKDHCGIHISRGSEAMRWLQRAGILKRAWVPFFERMKRGACYIDGLIMKKNGNQFGQNRKSVFAKAKSHKTYKETYKERNIFTFHVDESGRLVAARA